MLTHCLEAEQVDSGRTASPGLVLNFSPVQFEDVQITIGRIPYNEDGNRVLAELRQEHNTTHVFRRDCGRSILAVAVHADAPLIGKPETIRLSQHLGLVAALVRNALLNSVAGRFQTSLSYEPLQVISRNDLLASSCFAGITPPEWLSVRLVYQVSIRTLYFVGREPFVAAVLDLRTTRLIERTAAELIADGICLNGTYVGRMIRNPDVRIAPRFDSLGCVVSVEGSVLRLTDSPYGIDAVAASEVWPEKKFFQACVSHVFKHDTAEVIAAVEAQRAALRHGPRRLNNIRKIHEFTSKRPHEMAAGVPFRFGPLLDDSFAAFPNFEAAPEPMYVFDGTGSKTDTRHEKGLNQFGPYTANVQTFAPPRVCVICQASKKGEVDQFLRKFFSLGVDHPSHRERGFCQKYRVNTVHYEFFLADGRSADAYRKACQEAVEKHGEGDRWDLALVQIEEAFRELPHEADPYLIAKLAFHTVQIQVQQFSIETTRMPAGQLRFCIANMALATYAKLGGTPCLLKASPIGAHELIVGLGTADIGHGRLARRERFVGVTTLFTADGDYYLSNVSKAVAADEYRKALLKTLKAAVSNVQTGMNWQRGDRVVLVFHALFKRFSHNEVDAVAELIAEFGDYDIKHAFVELDQEHPYLIFDTSQRGEMAFGCSRLKGEFAPTRGQYLQLTDREVLLCLTGPKQLKRPEDGTPRPILVRLHKDSSFTDMKHLVEQVYAFSCHSWRTFGPSSMPVTIQYSDLIASNLGKLSRLQQWNPDVMLDRIGRTPWFL
jgi:hypothetical protein